MRTVRWGIIGCGDVTEVKSGPAFQKVEGSELVAVMRRTGELAKDYARRHGVPKWYDNAEALIGDPDVNAIYVATPPSSHKHYTLLAAQAGKPVYVEKPMALNFGECQAMVQACHQAGVPLFVAYYRRTLARFLKIKELIDAQAIGDVRFITLTLSLPPGHLDLQAETLPWRVRPEIAGGGLFLDLASHQLDFLDYLLGPIREAQGLASNQAGLYSAEDIVTGTFRFESGVQGAGTWCFTASDRCDRTEIVGSEGRISYSTFDDEPVILMTGKDRQEFKVDYPAHVQQPLLQTVVDALTGKGTCPSTGESGARTSRVMDQILSGAPR